MVSQTESKPTIQYNESMKFHFDMLVSLWQDSLNSNSFLENESELAFSVPR